MSTQDDDRPGALWPVLLGVALLVVGLVIGLALGRDGRAVAALHAPPHTAVPPTVPATEGGAVSTADKASVKEEDGVVKFYFAGASAALAPDAQEALGIVVKGVAAGQKAVISGFGGDPAQGRELTGQRVQAVRATLAELGIGQDKMELTPLQAAASSAGRARVEVRLK